MTKTEQPHNFIINLYIYKSHYQANIYLFKSTIETLVKGVKYVQS